ncbi:RICIN domain-containing protein [Micromonospora sp. NBC_00362]|uniref:RICIN domain-containing protein n=1 Tax=Micromonospora sp. NBC_00362 TaxID=2975975 RepID=UPI00224E9124|nr:RICIN domain-containing protein [Micromonospora sp. NBC_00362]MCX5121729.1 RICIN domain-containing protein [Micromonospora sp. NBC_00362]
MVASLAIVSPANAYPIEKDVSWGNVNSGQCLLARGKVSGVTAVQTLCANYADQKWRMDVTKTSMVRIRNINSNLCLVVRGYASGAPVVTTPCANYKDQNWIPLTTANGRQIFMNENSRQCMVVRGYGLEAPVVQAPCSYNYIDQQWNEIYW